MEMLWGTSSSMTDLKPGVDQIRFRGVANVARRAVEGSTNRTADGTAAGFTATLSMRFGAALTGLLDNPEGALGLRLTSASTGRTWVVPMTVVDTTKRSPVEGVAGLDVMLVQDHDLTIGFYRLQAIGATGVEEPGTTVEVTSPNFLYVFAGNLGVYEGPPGAAITETLPTRGMRFAVLGPTIKAEGTR